MFRPGQEIVAIREHIEKAYQKGQIFMLRAIKDSNCKCMPYLIDIGFKLNGNFQTCGKCGEMHFTRSEIRWFDPINFAPIDSKEAQEALKEKPLEYIETIKSKKQHASYEQKK